MNTTETISKSDVYYIRARKMQEKKGRFIELNNALGTVREARLPNGDAKELYCKYLYEIKEAAFELMSFLGYSMYDDTVSHYAIYDNREDSKIMSFECPNQYVDVRRGEWVKFHIGDFKVVYFIFHLLEIESKLKPLTD